MTKKIAYLDSHTHIRSVIRELAETGGGRHGGGGRGETRGGHDRGINVLYVENPLLS